MNAQLHMPKIAGKKFNIFLTNSGNDGVNTILPSSNEGPNGRKIILTKKRVTWYFCAINKKSAITGNAGWLIPFVSLLTVWKKKSDFFKTAESCFRRAVKDIILLNRKWKLHRGGSVVHVRTRPMVYDTRCICVFIFSVSTAILILLRFVWRRFFFTLFVMFLIKCC